jgi:hypothetical protein
LGVRKKLPLIALRGFPSIRKVKKKGCNFISIGKRHPSISSIKSTSAPPDVRQWYNCGGIDKLDDIRKIKFETHDSNKGPRKCLRE